MTATTAAPLPVIYLTFDDGPSEYTASLLDLLADNDARVTFFLVGSAIGSRQDLVRRELAEGHAVANHSWSHPTLTRLDDAQIRRELSSTNDAIRKAGGESTCFRPPYGATNERVAGIANALGMHQILWNIDTRDWERQNVASISGHFGEPRNGTVILMHDGGGARSATVHATRLLLEKWKGRARFEALPQCRTGGATPEAQPSRGIAMSMPSVLGDPLGFVPITPRRIADTRVSTPMKAGEVLTVVAPQDVEGTALAVNLTVSNPAQAGFLQAWNCSAEPSTSVVNFAAHDIRAGATAVALDADRSFCVRSSAATDVIVDLTGSFDAVGGRARLVSRRALDTRRTEPLGPRWTPVDLGLPAGTTGVSVVATLMADGSSSAYLSLLPCAMVTGPEMVPSVSSVNGSATVANLVQIGTDGGLCAFASARRHVLLDVVAEWGAGTLAYRPITPTRVLDTRSGMSWNGRLAAGTWYEVAAMGPPIAGVAATITAVDAEGRGFASASPCASGEPLTSTIQIADSAIAGGTIIAGDRPCVYESVRSHLLLDVTGVFTE